MARATLELEMSDTRWATFAFELLLLSSFDILAYMSWNSLGQSVKLWSFIIWQNWHLKNAQGCEQSYCRWKKSPQLKHWDRRPPLPPWYPPLNPPPLPHPPPWLSYWSLSALYCSRGCCCWAKATTRIYVLLDSSMNGAGFCSMALNFHAWYCCAANARGFLPKSSSMSSKKSLPRHWWV